MAGHSQGLWLGLFFTAIPVGTAVGYGYGAVVSAWLGWEWAFYIEAFAMAPLVIGCLVMAAEGGDADDAEGAGSGTGGGGSGSGGRIASGGSSGGGGGSYSPRLALAHGGGWHLVAPASPRQKPSNARGAPSEEVIHHPAPSELEDDAVGGRDPAAAAAAAAAAASIASLWSELKACLSSPTYVLVVLGYAANTASIAGFATFGPQVREQESGAVRCDVVRLSVTTDPWPRCVSRTAVWPTTNHPRCARHGSSAFLLPQSCCLPVA